MPLHYHIDDQRQAGDMEQLDLACKGLTAWDLQRILDKLTAPEPTRVLRPRKCRNYEAIQGILAQIKPQQQICFLSFVAIRLATLEYTMLFLYYGRLSFIYVFQTVASLPVGYQLLVASLRQTRL